MSDTHAITNTGDDRISRPILIASIAGSANADVFDIEGLSNEQVYHKLSLYLSKLLVYSVKELFKYPPSNDDLSDEIMAFQESVKTALENFIATPNEQRIKCRRSIKDAKGDYQIMDLMVERCNEWVTRPKAQTVAVNDKAKDCGLVAGETKPANFTVSVVDTHLSMNIDNSDIKSVTHFNATAAIGGLHMIKQHLASQGVRFNDDGNSSLNQQACFRQLTDKLIGFYVDDAGTRDICTMIIDDKNNEHYFNVRVHKNAAQQGA